MTDMGIHVVVASGSIKSTHITGNSGQDSCETSPASATRNSAIISVGAIDQSDQVPVFSNYGVCTNVLAPGVRILSADASNSIEINVERKYIQIKVSNWD